jgi:hypothetical protein
MMSVGTQSKGASSTAVPLVGLLLRRPRQSPCSGWMCGGSLVLHLRGRSAGAVWGDLALRQFNDWRASAGARSGALPSCGARSRQSTSTRPQSTDRWQEPVHQAPYVTAAWGDLGAKLWALAVNHHRLRRPTPHMIIPAELRQ